MKCIPVAINEKSTTRINEPSKLSFFVVFILRPLDRNANFTPRLAIYPHFRSFIFYNSSRLRHLSIFFFLSLSLLFFLKLNLIDIVYRVDHRHRFETKFRTSHIRNIKTRVQLDYHYYYLRIFFVRYD